MDWKRAVNRGLERTTGMQVVRAGSVRPPVPPLAPAVAPRPVVDQAAKVLVRPSARPEIDRLVRRPVFLMSPVRSGSTLLRSLLNAHSMVLAPHELHVRRLRVQLTTSLVQTAMDLLDLNESDLEHLLWDRVMDRELRLSQKSCFVDKTPSNTFAWQRLHTCWPEARFIFLLRHPASIAASWAEVTQHKWTKREAVADSLRYMQATSRARNNLDGLTVRYEDLTADPARVTHEICDFLGLPWESGMLEYGGNEKYVKGVGDWSENIRSGRVQAGRQTPSIDEIPPRLRPVSRRWGYLDDEPSHEQSAAERLAEEESSAEEIDPDDSAADEA